MSITRKFIDRMNTRIVPSVLAAVDARAAERAAAKGYRFIVVMNTGSIETFGVEPVPSDIAGFYNWPGHTGARFPVKTHTLVDSPYGMKARELDGADAIVIATVDGEIADLSKKLVELRAERKDLCSRALVRGKKVKVRT